MMGHTPDIQYRVYADGDVVHQDDFEERDNALPYYDDYRTVDVPEELETYLIETNL